MFEECKWCNGTGDDGGGYNACPDCESTGLKGGRYALEKLDEEIERQYNESLK
jgi:RecJ-like exonuclease